MNNNQGNEVLAHHENAIEVGVGDEKMYING